MKVCDVLDFVDHEDGILDMGRDNQTDLDQTAETACILESEQRSSAVHHSGTELSHLKIGEITISHVTHSKAKVICETYNVAFIVPILVFSKLKKRQTSKTPVKIITVNRKVLHRNDKFGIAPSSNN